MKNVTKYILLSIIGFTLTIACNKSKPSSTETTITVTDSVETKIKTPDFKEYFELKEVNDSWKYYNSVYTKNELLGWSNVIDTTVSLEIRVYVSISWTSTEIYKLCYKDGLGWKGYLTTFIINRIEKRNEPFTPFMGWENFERALLVSDIKNIDVNKSINQDCESHFFHSTSVSIQLLMPTSSMIIPLDTYFSFSENCPDIEGVRAMDTLMHSLLDPTTYRDKYYP